jgi:GNAT superfamily N-acetyltransferase
LNEDIRDKDGLKIKLRSVDVPNGIYIREFKIDDFPFIQELYKEEGWMTAIKRPQDSLVAWENSWPALVAYEENGIIGVVRALTDGEITTYIAEIVVSNKYRGKGIGKCLIEACHKLFPHTRIDVLSSKESEDFYKMNEFRQNNGYRKSYY